MISEVIESMDFSSFEDKLILKYESILKNSNKKQNNIKNNDSVFNKKQSIETIENYHNENTQNSTFLNISNSVFSVSSFNNLSLKNKFCFLCGSDDYFFDSHGKIKSDYFDFYRNIAKSNVGLIFTGGFTADIKDTNLISKVLNNESFIDEFKNFVQEIHLYGSKIFMTIKSVFGRADRKNKFLNLCTYSASFNRTYFNSKLPCVRISDKICNKIIDEMVKISEFSKKSGFDGIMIDGDLFGFIGEISSSETNRRKFGYFSETYDFAKKLIENIIRINKICNIVYSISLKSYIYEIYGSDASKIHSIKNFNSADKVSELLNFMELLIKCGVDGFSITGGTFETEFLSSPTEFENDNIFEEIYLSINEYFKTKNIKNKFGNDIELIYKDSFSEFSSDIIVEDNILLDYTNQILSDNEYIYKLRKNIDSKNCIRCGYCTNKVDSYNAVSCILSPNLYYSGELEGTVANSNKEKIAVIGSGVAGINSCLYLAKKGYNVDLYESGDMLLKSNRLREIFGYNEPLKRYNDYLIKQIKSCENNGNLKVYLDLKFSTKAIDYLKYSTIIVATGSREKFLTIPGAVLKNVKNIYDALNNKNLILNKNYFIISAKSELSFSLAQYLLVMGKKVTLIIESTDFLMKMQNSKLTYYLYSLEKLKCKVFIGAKINKIESDFVEILLNRKFLNDSFAVTVLNLKSGASYKFDKRVKNIDMDLFIYEPETYSNNSIYYDLVSSKFEGKVFMIGSALYPCDLSESIKTAYYVAKNI